MVRSTFRRSAGARRGHRSRLSPHRVPTRNDALIGLHQHEQSAPDEPFSEHRIRPRSRRVRLRQPSRPRDLDAPTRRPWHRARRNQRRDLRLGVASETPTVSRSSSSLHQAERPAAPRFRIGPRAAIGSPTSRTRSVPYHRPPATGSGCVQSLSSPEASSLEVVVGRRQLLAGVHHEWAVCGDWFVDWLAGHDEHPSAGGAW